MTVASPSTQADRNRRPALIRVRRPSGVVATFVAEDVQVEGQLVTAAGRWSLPPRRPGLLSWPLDHIVEIRWQRETS